MMPNRMSVDSDEQATSYEAQVEHYTDFIKKNPEWEFAGILLGVISIIAVPFTLASAIGSDSNCGANFLIIDKKTVFFKSKSSIITASPLSTTSYTLHHTEFLNHRQVILYIRLPQSTPWSYS